MNNELKINILGESMSGKSLFIANLLNESQSKILKGLIDENKNGQTKVKTKYYIGNYDSIAIKKIKFNEDMDKEKLQNLKLDSSFINCFDEDEHCLNNIKIDFTDETIKKLYSEIINNKVYKDKIECVEIKCTGRDEVLEMLNKNKLDGIIFIDTRGFDDCIKDDLEKYEKLNRATFGENNSEIIDTKAYESLLAERGILESNLTILFTDQGGLKLTADKEYYKKLIMETIKTKPLVVISRSSLLTEAEENGAKYDELMENIKSDKSFDGKLKNETSLKTTCCLINDFKKDSAFENEYYKTIIDNIEYLLIPNLSDLDAQRIVYRDNQINVLSKVLIYYDKLNDIYIKAQNKFNDRLFSKDTINKLENAINKFFDSVNFIKLNYIEIEKKLSNNVYYGNFVGERGGITTNNGKNAREAIIIIQTMYDALRRSIVSIDVDDGVRQFMLEKLNSCFTMLDPTISFGYKVDRKFVKNVYYDLFNKSNKDYVTFINSLVKFVIDDYKKYLSDKNNL